MAPKHAFIFLTLMLLLAAAVSASFTDEWGEYQDDPSNRGFVHDETAHFTSELGITYTSNNGMAFQPLIVNITGDNNLETIIISGNFLQLYDEQMNLIDELNVLGGNVIKGQPIIYNNGSQKYILFKSATGNPAEITFEIYEYNSSNEFNQVCENSSFANFGVTSTSFVNSGIKCDETNDYCYWISGTGNTNRFAFTKINMEILNCSSFNQILNYTTDSPNQIHANIPAIGDIDRDGRNEIVFICDDNTDTNSGLCVVDSNGTGTPYFDTYFSTDGKLDNIGTIMSNPVLWNTNGAGDTEIQISYKDATNRLELASYLSDGTQDWSIESTGSNIDTASQVVIVDNGSTQFDICTSGTLDFGGGVFRLWLLCADYNGDKIIGTYINTDEALVNSIPLVAADMDNDGLDEIIMPRGIFDIDYNLVVNTTENNRYYIAIADVNADGEPEIITTNGSLTKIIYSSFTNEPPELNNTQNYGGYGATLDYTTPICVGSTLTFLAQECGGLATCNYDNDGSSDTERIVSNCGQLSSGAASSSFITNLANGTFAGANPQFQCVYNVTGIFSVRLFLQDNFNDDDFTQYNTQTITVQVINGTAGITCNLGSAVSPGDTGGITPSAQESQTNEAVEDTLGILFGSGSGSDKLKLIVGIALILGIIIAAYREGVTSGAGVLVVAGFATLLVTFIGLITPAIFILSFAFIIFIIFIGRAVVGGGTPNGGP